MVLFGKDKDAEQVRNLQQAQERLMYAQQAQILGSSVDADYIKNTELLRVTLDESSVIRDFETDLLGLLWDEQTKQYIQVYRSDGKGNLLVDELGNPVPFRKMNRQGVFSVTSVLKFSMHKSRRLAILDSNEIPKFAINAMLNNCLTLCEKRSEYEMDIAYMDEVVDVLSDENYFSLSRSIGGRETDMIHKQSQNTEIIHKHPDKNPQGVLNKVFGG